MDHLVYKQIVALSDEVDPIAFLANCSACLNEALQDINWIGFYLYKDNELVLGPFQGKVACSRLPLDKGVCASAFNKKMTVYVEAVHQFPTHIACDSASNSEVVIPLLKNDSCLGVLDIDSPSFGRFTTDEIELLECIATIIASKL